MSCTKSQRYELTPSSRLKDVWPCVNHVLASCEERRLYSQARIHVASREVEIMRKLSHDCVLTFCGADQYVDEQGGLHTLILTEYCHCGNLNERLHRPSSASVNFKWMQQNRRRTCLCTLMECGLS